ncbi:MAG TPA: DmsC/YnfH family molybdoenzyme membrane anchor subunit [Bryobacteraceae bacterium]|nr:DmsC/YnfH family molybdoenzyme membrane anchor subunit [Bryobacteraceae bacterium]
MSLLLLERARQGDPLFRLTTDGPTCGAGSTSLGLIPGRPPARGEQYRFHFDMTKCIGCRCCEVACSEQNGNSFEINWRRVGEIEGGIYPNAKRHYLSMGCNHCLDAACLKGCPVNAYRKDSHTGLVLHNPNTCIGCGYCTWNCPYGVPQFNPERGVVGKCDMCHGRLAEGREPACVNACPESAIRVELVNIAEWRENYESANAPGMPGANHTVSTTRITLPPALTAEMKRADYHRVRPEHPHLPLVFMLVLTQLSVGAFLGLLPIGVRQWRAELAALAVALISLGASTLHLGRPAYAWRALKMWRRSWLSREVLLFSLFANLAMVSAATGLRSLAIATVLAGAAGITASAFIYMVPARPAWNSKLTLADFYGTALLLGPLFLSALGVPVKPVLVAAAAAFQILVQTAKFLHLACSEEFELRTSSRLLAYDLRLLVIARMALLILGGIVLPFTGHSAIGFAIALAGEWLSRYLFFVSVVPKSMAASFFRRKAA